MLMLHMKWILCYTEAFHIVSHLCVLLGIINLIPPQIGLKVLYFTTDLSMGSIILARRRYLGRPGPGTFWGILYGINIVNHCRAIAYLLGQHDEFMEIVFYLAHSPDSINLFMGGHQWYVIATAVDITFHGLNVCALINESRQGPAGPKCTVWPVPC